MSVRVEKSSGGAVATITLDRPDRLNALDLELATELEAALRGPAGGAEVILLEASGRAFCAGGDIQAMVDSGTPSAYLRELTGRVHAALVTIAEHPAVVVARVHGAVAGGGLGLVLATDIAVGSTSATFTAAYGAVGLTPDCGISYLLPAAVGARRARDFLLAGRSIPAETAQDWGLLADVVAPDGLDARVEALVEAVRRSGRAAAGATKRLLARDLFDYRHHLEAEADQIVFQSDQEPAFARLTSFAGHA
jgi:2-(1,2-epoxy-1,2-dihydrophenyl)acetyl-CoA isomerase